MRITADNLTKPVRTASQDGEARHPLESITPVGLVLLFLLSICAGLVLAVLLKVLSMALSVG